MKKLFWRSWCLSLFLLLATQAIAGQVVLTAAPEDVVGLSSERLSRIDNVMQGYVDQNIMPGAVAMIVREGKIAYLKSFGMADIDAKKPMKNDTIFRIASMTKPITSVAVMMLYEEGHFILDDPISKFIPSFKDPKVLVPASSKEAASTQNTVPAKSEITIRHLLNHTSGLTYRFMGKPQTEIYKKAGISDGLGPNEGTIGDKMTTLGGLPLAHQPGETWDYGLSLDVLGYLVEIVSKMSLDEFFQKRIFEPLGMKDTYFYIPQEKLPRLASIYSPSKNGSMSKVPEGPIETWGGAFVYTTSYPNQKEQTYFSGGSGLVSTASDYAKFLQMMVNGGEYNGVRLLGRKTVELMTTPSIGDKKIYWREHFGDTFGYGFAIRTQRGMYDQLESIGSYSWGGIFYTRFWVDPKEELFGILLIQMAPGYLPTIARTFRVLCYQSIID